MKALLISSAAKLRRQEALLDGARKLGYTIQSINIHGNHMAAREMEGASFAVCSGMRNTTLAGRRRCQQHDIDIAIVELGYLKRAANNDDLVGHFQLGWNRIGWVPEAPVPSDRLARLNLEIKEVHTGGEYILAAGQVGFDAQHNLSSFDLMKWLHQKSEEARRVWKLPVVYRPHPLQASMLPDWASRPTIQNPRLVSLQQALDKAAVIVTYNSTLGVDAMLRGIPVISDAKAHYYGHAVSDLATRMTYLERLAYAQWTLEELASGEALQFLLSRK